MAFFTSTKIKIVMILIFLIIVIQTCKIYLNRSSYKEPVSEHPVDVAVYYEALCPDSKYFFIHNLNDAYNQLHANMNVHLIPYGKARTFIGKEGEINFECQHGELECYANKIHACTIDILPDLVNHLPIIICMIKDNMDPEEALRRCAPTSNQSSILECAQTTYGSELLKGHGLKTTVVRPSFIPTIYVGGKKGNQAALLKNLTKELCKYFSIETKPSACS